jgi:hypothetical protein
VGGSGQEPDSSAFISVASDVSDKHVCYIFRVVSTG